MYPKLYISQNSNTEKFVQFFLAPFAIPQFSGVSLCEEKNLCVLTPAVMSYLFSYTYFSSINVMYGTYNTNYNRPEEGSDKTGTLSICPLYGFLIPSPRLSPPARGGGKGGGRGKRGQGACGTTHYETEVKVDMRINQRLRPWSRNRHWLAVNWHLSNQLDQQESLPSYSMSLPLRAVRKII